MKVITLAVYAGPKNDQPENVSDLKYQAALNWRESIVNKSIAETEDSIREAVSAGEALPELPKFPLDELHIAILFNAETGEAIPPTDERIVKAYQTYLDIPLTTRRANSEIYPVWVILTGRACIHPHPHRHFKPKEFYERLGLWPDLAERFLV